MKVVKVRKKALDKTLVQVRVAEGGRMREYE